MVADQVRDFLENGNIRKRREFPGGHRLAPHGSSAHLRQRERAEHAGPDLRGLRPGGHQHSRHGEFVTRGAGLHRGGSRRPGPTRGAAAGVVHQGRPHGAVDGELGKPRLRTHAARETRTSQAVRTREETGVEPVALVGPQDQLDDRCVGTRAFASRSRRRRGDVTRMVAARHHARVSRRPRGGLRRALRARGRRPTRPPRCPALHTRTLASLPVRFHHQAPEPSDRIRPPDFSVSDGEAGMIPRAAGVGDIRSHRRPQARSLRARNKRRLSR